MMVSTTRRIKIKILFLDVETAPNLAYVWKLWDNNVGLDMLLDEAYMLCWSAKWLGEEYVYYDSVHISSRKTMLKNMHKLMDEADAVVTYNGDRFDIPHLNREFIEEGLLPPSPYKQIDLYKTVKQQFKFPSNKLEYVAKKLGVGSKLKHIGFELWHRCIKKDPEAWAMMEDYNVQDTVLLEKVYYKLLPWIKGHANHSLYAEDSLVCPNCGSNKLQKRGFAYTLASKYQRYKCGDCGHWSKDSKIINRNHYKTTSVQ